MTDVVDHLLRLGLNEYEAKAYIAAVALGEGTIKEISDESGVPRSRAYDVMQRLAEKGLVEVGNSTPLYYRANEPTKASNHLMEEIKFASDEATRYLNEIGRKAEKRDNPIWTLKGDWAINHKVCEMIESAKDHVDVVCANNKHIVRYAKCIAEASKTKSVTVVISHHPESFVGSLGNAKIMKLNEFWDKGKAPTGGEMSERGFTTKDGKYNLELSVVSDHADSMILTREGDGYRAIICSGTVISYFFRLMVDQIIEHADLVSGES
ncbi:MAG TPA: helix-turn-helix domain-containing protein [Methanomassiliicoccales archaeon]|jgi:sugar-specific transcriptional regulator TrmB